jgi:hypothetical protein
MVGKSKTAGSDLDITRDSEGERDAAGQKQQSDPARDAR